MVASLRLLFVFISAIIGSSCTKIPYDEIDINIFDKSTSNIEVNVLASMHMVNGFYARDDISLAISACVILAKCVPLPYIKEIVKIIPLMRNTLEERNEWRSVFSKAISEETMRAVTDSEIRWMEATLKTIETKVKLLGDDNLDTENRKTIASIIHTDIDKMINLFDLQVSLFKKYPLMGAPPLIQLASLIAMFSPIAKTLIPIEAVNPDSSCKMRDILIDYRPRIVNARLRELHSKVSSFGSRLKVLALLYNPNGYNQTSPGEIDCKKGCELDHAPNEYCLEDKFSNNSFECTIKGGKSVCVEDYGKLIRHRVEKLFPVDLLDKLCSDRKPKIPTGFGWFTLEVEKVYLYEELFPLAPNIGYSWIANCSPVIKLYVDNKKVLKTARSIDGFFLDAKITFTTAKIQKNSTIRIEVWDERTGFMNPSELMFTKEGTISSFLKNQQRAKGHDFTEHANRIETVSFWRDEYE